MSMFCYQCQETAKNTGCTKKGVCGKEARTAGLQDVLVYALKGLASVASRRATRGESVTAQAAIIERGLFATITNANFDDDRIISLCLEALEEKSRTAAEIGANADARNERSSVELWQASTPEELEAKSADASILNEENEDLRSLRELTVYGLKGMCAYLHHARVLGHRSDEMEREVVEILSATVGPSGMDDLLQLVLRTGNACAGAMRLLDTANTARYGNPEMTTVSIEPRGRPGILISGHDLKDLEELLEQSKDSGVDIYTHGEMLPAHYYPAFKRHEHFVGNYGNAWWKQATEFASFNGAILMTTNCIVPVKDSYRDRIFTTGLAGYPGVSHIDEGADGSTKDFSEVIARAKQCAPPQSIEKGEIVGGFAHHQVEILAPKIVEAVKAGKIKKFVVMAGCDGRMRSREYFTSLAQELPGDTVILTAGCAKYRYNKLDLGDIGGIPRVLDAGQCNDSYSIVVTALKLKEAFGVEDVNDLPIDFAVAWYEQKAVTVLLALLALGFRGVRIGPTLPAFLSENVRRVLIEKFDLKQTDEVAADLAAITG